MANDAGANYSEVELDALRELANIGTGAATVPLHRALQRSSSLQVPRSIVVRLPDSFDYLGSPEAEVTAAFVQLAGDAPAPLLLIADADSATTIARLGGGEGAEVALGALANALASEYAEAIARTTGLRLVATDAVAVSDMLGAVIDEAVGVPASEHDNFLVLLTSLDFGEPRCQLMLACLPPRSSAQRLLGALPLRDRKAIVR